jgi:hypothetical protein
MKKTQEDGQKKEIIIYKCLMEFNLINKECLALQLREDSNKFKCKMKI